MTNTAAATRACPICAPDRPGLEHPRDFAIIKGYPLKRCPNCELQLFDPQPDDPTLAAIYKEEYYNAWGMHDDESSTRALKLATFDRMLRPLRACQ